MDENGFIAFMFIAGIILGGCIVAAMMQTHYRGASIEYGCAEYDKTTGEFEWKTLK